ncbi:uncharacterized protein BDW43DRAFT_323825 [Aspergillus alliaceus]|uniref:uncharacterized protein n=1 Tax=Petromyces alliaceus TaxID=209559 RepID=UPI0012A6B37F|nr:uncharacterized protein BDW43DRAFT_323825 [Aspergillus alliaceus]KAB8227556.1 hypothetical protein BDW43DRAFT_323825 [Aspergillus alliaceus]
MSLITDGVLMGLWEGAQAQSSDEWASAKLWSYLWNKHLFAEKEWVVSSETPPEGRGRRRVDITIEYFGGDSKLAVLAFHEAKALNAGPQDVQDAEHQAFDACMRYLGEHPELQFVYAFTSFGTKGRAWRCAREDIYLSPLFGSDHLAERTEYVELHSSEAQQIRQAVQMMKAVPPSG